MSHTRNRAQEASASAARKVPARVRALDGVALGATWHLPVAPGPYADAVVIAAGAGIPAAYYRNLASALAQQGLAVLTFDYRGVGLSRRAGPDALTADVLTWGRDDLGGALEHAAERFPAARLAVVTHSFAAAILGAAPAADRIRRAVFLGPHTGYWGDYGKRWRLPLFVAWHVAMPAVTRVVGHFPGRRLGLGIDLPRGVALEWAGRRRAELSASRGTHRRWQDTLAGFRRVRADTLVVAVTDDAFAPPPAATRLVALYPSLATHMRSVAPAELGFHRLGHLGFLRRSTGPFFWKLISAWILHGEVPQSMSPRDAPAAARATPAQPTPDASHATAATPDR